MFTLKSWALPSLFVLVTATSYAENFPCYIQFAKESCWQGYDVTIQLQDGSSQAAIGSPIVLAKNDFNVLKPFSCSPNQQISAQASFSPPIWEENKDAKYQIKSFWTVPMHLPPDLDKWIVKVCFGNDFVSVPIPPTGSGVCKCTFPEIEQKINYKIKTIVK